MSEMIVLGEHTGTLLRAAVVSFGTVQGYVLFQPVAEPWPGADSLWICGVQDHVQRCHGAAAAAVLDPEPEIMLGVRRGIALLGLPAVVLAMGPEVCAEQCARWEVSEFDRVDADLIWATRGRVFGGALTRVPRALAALDRYYVPEGPLSEDEIREVLR